MNVKDFNNILPRDMKDIATDDDLEYVNQGFMLCKTLPEYFEEEFIQNLQSNKIASNDSIKKYVDALAYCIMRFSGETSTNSWATVFRVKSVGMNQETIHRMSYVFSRLKLTSVLLDSMDQSVRIRYIGTKYKAIDRMIGLMNGEAAPSIIPQFIYKNGIQHPMYDEDGNRAYNETYMVVTPKIQMEASQKVFDVLEKAEAIKIEVDHSSDTGTLMLDKLTQIANAQHDRVVNGDNIEDVQVIGNLLSKDIEDE